METMLAEGLEQTFAYMDMCGCYIPFFRLSYVLQESAPQTFYN